jgi:alpha-galactosidase
MEFIDLNQAIPESIEIETDERKNTTKFSNNEWTFADVCVKAVRTKEGSQWILESPTKSIRRVKISWDISLTGKEMIFGDVLERSYGDLQWRQIDSEYFPAWFVMITDYMRTDCYGVKTCPNAICFWNIANNRLSLLLDVRCLGAGVTLGGKKLIMAETVSLKGTADMDEFDTECRFARKMSTSPSIPDKVIYGGNNWYYAYGKSSKREIIDDAAFISEVSSGIKNRPYYVIDACWQESITDGLVASGGPYDGGNEKFGDMSAIAEDLNKIGVIPGIWCRMTVYRKDLEKNQIIRNLPEGYAVDITSPAIQEMIADDIRKMVEWGYRLIKHDFSTYDIIGKWGFEAGTSLTDTNTGFCDKSITTAQALKKLYEIIRENSNGAVIIGCNVIGHLIVGNAEIVRTGDDTSGLEWDRTKKMGVNTLSHRLALNNVLYRCDPDCIGITRNIDWNKNSQWLDIVSRTGTALFVSAGTDCRDGITANSIAEAFKRANALSENIKPFDWTVNTCPKYWGDTSRIYSYEWI